MKGGVLIIGSLYWDIDQGEHKNIRKEWRNKRLQFGKRIHVFAPIRYGRRSGKGVYTMVFSNSIEDGGDWGTAYVAPFKNEMRRFQGIYNQARYLSHAEGAADTNLVKRANGIIWCVIGILFNPKIEPKQKEKLLGQYEQKLNEETPGNEYLKFCIAPEPSILSARGEILIKWPNATNKKNQLELDALDFIIATCPKQNLPAYPNAKIMKPAVAADKRNYFYNNIANGITTYQDREIINA